MEKLLKECLCLWVAASSSFRSMGWYRTRMDRKKMQGFRIVIV